MTRARGMVGLLVAMLVSAGGSVRAEGTLTVWWSKGFYKSEDEALQRTIANFEAKTGIKVELTRHEVQDGVPKAVAALTAGAPPDVAYGDVFDFQVTGKWAFEGRLADISDIIEPIRDRFLPNTVETTRLWNGKSGKRAYYAFPLRQQTIHVQYWRDMLAEAGFTDADIPTTWKAYWSFWCDTVQPALRTRTGKPVFATGFPMGSDSSNSYYSFLTFVDAYGVRLVEDDGKLRVDRPEVRRGLVDALRDYTEPWRKGCTPPSSTSWKDADNNRAFHNRTTMMTHNPTISIAAKWYDDLNNLTFDPQRRAQARRNHEELIVTSGFPRKPDGTTMSYRAAVKTGVVFEAAKNKKEARQFVTFLLQDENLIPYVEGSLGRWYPVTNSGAARLSFWLADPHRASVQRQFAAGTTPFEFTRNFRFTILNNENVWAKAMHRVVTDKVPVEKAVDEMIARIKKVANDQNPRQ